MPVTLISGSSFTVNQEEVTHVEKTNFRWYASRSGSDSLHLQPL